LARQDFRAVGHCCFGLFGFQRALARLNARVLPITGEVARGDALARTTVGKIADWELGEAIIFLFFGWKRLREKWRRCAPRID
jgi:hypothetical protein